MVGQCHLTSPAFAALEFVFINVKYCKDSKKHRHLFSTDSMSTYSSNN